jgi:hypothetical protein
MGRRPELAYRPEHLRNGRLVSLLDARLQQMKVVQVPDSTSGAQPGQSLRRPSAVFSQLLQHRIVPQRHLCRRWVQ